jgi:nitrogen fixation-related uncharacterized protein
LTRVLTVVALIGFRVLWWGIKSQNFIAEEIEA